MRKVTSVAILSTMSFFVANANAVSFDPVTGKVIESQEEANTRHDKEGVANWAFANQADGKASSALYFANKNHADIKEVKATQATYQQQSNDAFANQQQHLEVHDQALLGLAKGMDTITASVKENTRRLDTDDRQLDHLQQVANSQGADIRQNTASLKQQEYRIGALEETAVSSEIASNNSEVARVNSEEALGHSLEAVDSSKAALASTAVLDGRVTEETKERILNDTTTNQRIDKSFEVTANHEGRIVSLEDGQKDAAGKLNIVQTAVSRQANKQVETDRHLSQNDSGIQRAQSTASNAKTLAEKAITGNEDNARTNENQQVWITKVQTTADFAASKVPVFEAGIDQNSKRIDGIDRNLAQTAGDASYARGKADFLDHRTIEMGTTIETQGKQITELNNGQAVQDAKLDNHGNRITSLEGRTGAVEKDLSATKSQVKTNTANIQTVNHTANVAYQNTQINAQNIHEVDRASAERSKAVLSESKSYTDAAEQRMDSRVEKLRSDAFSGIAGVAAMANMPIIPGEGWAMSASSGFYKNASAVAVGVQYQPSATDAFKVSGSISNSGDGVYGAGFTHKF